MCENMKPYYAYGICRIADKDFIAKISEGEDWAKAREGWLDDLFKGARFEGNIFDLDIAT